MNRQGQSLWMSGLFGVALLGQAEEPLPVIALPPLEVSADVVGRRSWRYWQSTDVEVLSRCSDAVTWEFVRAHARLVAMLDHVLPADLQVQMTLPMAFLLAEPDDTAGRTQNLISGFSGKEPTGRRTIQTVRTMPNLRLSDVDRSLVFALLDERNIDGDVLALTEAYIHYRLTRRVPGLPKWFVAGFLALFPKLTFGSTVIEVAPADWSPAAEGERIRRDSKHPRVLLPMGRLLEEAPPVEDPDQHELWRAEAALFIRWALDGDRPERRAGFFRLVAQAAQGPVTEDDCRRELGLDYAALIEQLHHYLPVALRRSTDLKPPRPPRLDRPEFQLATRAQIVRIKGEWERLAISYVKSRAPEFADTFIEQTHRTLMRAYEEGERDPDFMAITGLFEYDVGNFAAARTYLEEAVRQKVVRPRAYLELAKLRHADAVARPYNSDGTLAANQIRDILAPLEAGRAWQPALPGNYSLAAETLGRGREPVTDEEFRRLEEALDYFPENAGLLYYLAALRLANGHWEKSALLIERGLRSPGALRVLPHFERLQKQLADSIPR